MRYLWMASGYVPVSLFKFHNSAGRAVAARCRSLKDYLIHLITQERGATVVMFAFMFPVLLGFAGLAIDGSNIYLQQQRMQISADAAVMAGIRLLALGNSTPLAIKNEVGGLAEANGADSYTLDYLNNNSEIHVTATRTFDTYFTPIMGLDTMTVSAEANARFGSVSKIGALMPMTLTCSEMKNYTLGVEYILHDTDKLGAGNVGWLTWNGAVSASVLAESINKLNSPMLAVGDVMKGTSGNKGTAAVTAALNALIGKTVTVPLYDQVTGTGSNVRYRVCAFAQFVLVRWDKSTITGKFVRGVVSGTDFSFDNPDFGSRDVRFTK